MNLKELEPKLLTTLREGYSLDLFLKDLIAGAVVGIVALPLGIAFGIASGVKPEQGLYTAIIAGFLISFFSGSRVQIGGPTGAFIVIVYAIVEKHGYAGLQLATLMAGVLLLVMGFAGLGNIIKFIPYPVTVGFTSGIGLIIFTAQIRDFLGLSLDKVPGPFLEKLAVLSAYLDTINYFALALGSLTLALVFFWPKVSNKIPGSLVAILLTTALVHIFKLPVDTIGSRFGSVPASLPAPSMPTVSWELLRELSSPALTIALLAAIESLLSAVVADGMTGRKHRSNAELVAQGVANIVSPLFQGIPATGAIARTATNIRNGAQTPVAGMIHALVLLLIILFFGSWAELIPLATLAGILMVVAIHMSELHTFVRLFKSPRSDVLVLLSTFLLTVFVDLTVAIEVGIVLAALLFMKRMADIAEANYITLQGEEPITESKHGTATHKGIAIFEIQGPFFFGAADKFKSALGQIEVPPPILILNLEDVPVMDATGIRALEDIIERSTKRGTHLIIAGVKPRVFELFKQSGILQQVGSGNIFTALDSALIWAEELLHKTPAELDHTT